MLWRSLVGWGCSAALLLVPAAARADMFEGDLRLVPGEVVLTGLGDFPTYRFVIAVANSDAFKGTKIPPPTPVREGEPASLAAGYFMDLRAVAVDAPEPVTYDVLASSHAPRSSVVSARELRVRTTSTERVRRMHYQVRQVKVGLISVELLSDVAIMADGSERTVEKLIPYWCEIGSFEAPPGWHLFLMANPTWPRAEPPLPVVPYRVGDVLTLFPGPRDLVAVEGAPEPDGSLAGRPYAAHGGALDGWARAAVDENRPVVALRMSLAVKVVPGKALEVTTTRLYQDAKGRWYQDDQLELPVEEPTPRWWWAAGGGGAAALMAGVWALVRRRPGGAR